MTLLIQKFGGTSVGSIDRIIHSANIVRETIAAGHQVVVVVSAMAGETDRLITLAHQINHTPDLREYDALISTGECVSAALFAMALQKNNLSALSLTAWQAQIKTTGSHAFSRITHVGSKITKLLKRKIIPIVTGFQGINDDDAVTTLGRGGSDTTAVTLAAMLRADECQIYTDVEGVYTADPRIVPAARLLSSITTTEMLTLSSLGAKVLHAEAALVCQKNKTPVRVLSSFTEGRGTLISDAEKKPPSRVSGIAVDQKQIKIIFQNLENEVAAEKLLSALSLVDCDIDMIVPSHAGSHVDITFTIHAEKKSIALPVLQTIATQFSVNMMTDDAVAKLSLVGLGMKSHAGFAAKIFETMSENNITLQLITSTDTKICLLVAKSHATQCANVLHGAFALSDACAVPITSQSQYRS